MISRSCEDDGKQPDITNCTWMMKDQFDLVIDSYSYNPAKS